MKRVSTLLVALAAFVYLAAIPAFAQRGGRGGGMGGGVGAGGGLGAGGVGAGGMGRGGDMGGPGIGRGSHGNAGQQGGQAQKINAKGSPDQMLQQHPKLESKLASLLPQGTNMQQAAAGFKNLGQFVAAVHVSHNLGIPFDQLKSTMLGPPSESLGKAIHTLKPDANAKTEAKKAEEQGKQDLTQPDTDNDNS